MHTIDVTLLKYTIPERDFKKLGFTFSKHGASRYKSYSLKHPLYKTETLLWTFVAGKDIELPNLEYRTFDVIEQCKKQIKNKDLAYDSKYIKFHINLKTGEIVTHKQLNRLERDLEKQKMDENGNLTKEQVTEIMIETHDKVRGRYWREFVITVERFKKLMKVIKQLKPETVKKTVEIF